MFPLLSEAMVTACCSHRELLPLTSRQTSTTQSTYTSNANPA